MSMRREPSLERGKSRIVSYSNNGYVTTREFGLNFAARNGFLKGQGKLKKGRKQK